MDGALDKLVAHTGVAVPLAADIIKVILESGASQIEIGIALNVADQLRHLLPVALVSENVRHSPRG
jgi:hypothetical protein